MFIQKLLSATFLRGAACRGLRGGSLLCGCASLASRRRCCVVAGLPETGAAHCVIGWRPLRCCRPKATTQWLELTIAALDFQIPIRPVHKPERSIVVDHAVWRQLRGERCNAFRLGRGPLNIAGCHARRNQPVVASAIFSAGRKLNLDTVFKVHPCGSIVRCSDRRL